MKRNSAYCRLRAIASVYGIRALPLQGLLPKSIGEGLGGRENLPEKTTVYVRSAGKVLDASSKFQVVKSDELRLKRLMQEMYISLSRTDPAISMQDFVLRDARTGAPIKTVRDLDTTLARSSGHTGIWLTYAVTDKPAQPMKPLPQVSERVAQIKVAQPETNVKTLDKVAQQICGEVGRAMVGTQDWGSARLAIGDVTRRHVQDLRALGLRDAPTIASMIASDLSHALHKMRPQIKERPDAQQPQAYAMNAQRSEVWAALKQRLSGEQTAKPPQNVGLVLVVPGTGAAAAAASGGGGGEAAAASRGKYYMPSPTPKLPILTVQDGKATPSSTSVQNKSAMLGRDLLKERGFEPLKANSGAPCAAHARIGCDTCKKHRKDKDISAEANDPDLTPIGHHYHRREHHTLLGELTHPILAESSSGKSPTQNVGDRLHHHRHNRHDHHTVTGEALHDLFVDSAVAPDKVGNLLHHHHRRRRRHLDDEMHPLGNETAAERDIRFHQREARRKHQHMILKEAPGSTVITSKVGCNLCAAGHKKCHHHGLLGDMFHPHEHHHHDVEPIAPATSASAPDVNAPPPTAAGIGCNLCTAGHKECHHHGMISGLLHPHEHHHHDASATVADKIGCHMCSAGHKACPHRGLVCNLFHPHSHHHHSDASLTAAAPVGPLMHVDKHYYSSGDEAPVRSSAAPIASDYMGKCRSRSPSDSSSSSSSSSDSDSDSGSGSGSESDSAKRRSRLSRATASSAAAQQQQVGHCRSRSRSASPSSSSSSRSPSPSKPNPMGAGIASKRLGAHRRSRSASPSSSDSSRSPSPRRTSPSSAKRMGDELPASPVARIFHHGVGARPDLSYAAVMVTNRMTDGEHCPVDPAVIYVDGQQVASLGYGKMEMYYIKGGKHRIAIGSEKGGMLVDEADYSFRPDWAYGAMLMRGASHPFVFMEVPRPSTLLLGKMVDAKMAQVRGVAQPGMNIMLVDAASKAKYSIGSAYTQVPAGPKLVRIYVTGQPKPAKQKEPIALNVGAAYTVGGGIKNTKGGNREWWTHLQTDDSRQPPKASAAAATSAATGAATATGTASEGFTFF